MFASLMFAPYPRPILDMLIRNGVFAFGFLYLPVHIILRLKRTIQQRLKKNEN